MKKTVVKVNMNCQICKKDSLRAVTKLTGIDMVAVDDEKGTLTVVGVVDPLFIVKRLRKIGKNAEIISVGPEPPPKPPSESTTSAQPRSDPVSFDLPPCCNQCQLVAVGYVLFDDGQVCNIL
ncbi:hypothetical protein M0R45_009668 [Rubus argutus]|uniref:HMA domain-containing protein n=1 Tax=Rubus argutus TaxID=59490 RepID=A0AAW1Y789_RUBAR